MNHILSFHVCISAALKLEDASEFPGRLVKAQIAVPIPRLSDLRGEKKGLGVCISDQFPGGGAATGAEPTL